MDAALSTRQRNRTLRMYLENYYRLAALSAGKGAVVIVLFARGFVQIVVVVDAACLFVCRTQD